MKDLHSLNLSLQGILRNSEVSVFFKVIIRNTMIYKVFLIVTENQLCSFFFGYSVSDLIEITPAIVHQANQYNYKSSCVTSLQLILQLTAENISFRNKIFDSQWLLFFKYEIKFKFTFIKYLLRNLVDKATNMGQILSCFRIRLIQFIF